MVVSGDRFLHKSKTASAIMVFVINRNSNWRYEVKKTRIQPEFHQQ